MSNKLSVGVRYRESFIDLPRTQVLTEQLSSHRLLSKLAEIFSGEVQQLWMIAEVNQD